MLFHDLNEKTCHRCQAWALLTRHIAFTDILLPYLFGLLPDSVLVITGYDCVQFCQNKKVSITIDIAWPLSLFHNKKIINFCYCQPRVFIPLYTISTKPFNNRWCLPGIKAHKFVIVRNYEHNYPESIYMQTDLTSN